MTENILLKFIFCSSSALICRSQLERKPIVCSKCQCTTNKPGFPHHLGFPTRNKNTTKYTQNITKYDQNTNKYNQMSVHQPRNLVSHLTWNFQLKINILPNSLKMRLYKKRTSQNITEIPKNTSHLEFPTQKY